MSNGVWPIDTASAYGNEAEVGQAVREAVEEGITQISEEHTKSSAQVILRWNLQKGVVVIPGSSNLDQLPVPGAFP